MGNGGPKTAQGKAAVARNAVTHGLLSAAPIAAMMERPADWETHLVGTVASLGAAGHIEVVLAERIAGLLWRLGRVARYESETIQQGQESVAADIAKRRIAAAAVNGSRSGVTAWLDDAQGALADGRTLVRLLRRLTLLPDDRPLSGSSASAILYAVTEGTDADLDEMDLPGVPDGVRLDTAPGWTAGRVRACIDFIAAEAEQSAGELLEAARGRARLEEIRARTRVETIEREVATLSRERLLPDSLTLDKISRYEAHLNRQLTSALHELEALQSRREGRPTPLARLDVSGMPAQ